MAQYMNLFRWLFARRSIRSEAMYHYRLGLARDKKGDLDGAMAAYSSAISLENAPDDIKSMALYNRALLFAARGDRSKAAADLNAVMVMPTSVPGVTTAARRRLERLQHRQDAADSARSERKRTP
jgi:tetratricopeptide (TPR) repeat protein